VRPAVFHARSAGAHTRKKNNTYVVLLCSLDCAATSPRSLRDARASAGREKRNPIAAVYVSADSNTQGGASRPIPAASSSISDSRKKQSFIFSIFSLLARLRCHESALAA